MSKKVTKQRFEYVTKRLREIEQAITEPGSRSWVYGEPDFNSSAFQEYQQEYTDLMQDSIQYVSTHTHSVGKAANKYLVTFTMDPKQPKTKQEFKNAVIGQLKRKMWDRVDASFEHEETNLHCHALVETQHRITKKEFEAQARKFGYVDVRPADTDNGIYEYISKESEVFTIVAQQLVEK